MIVDCHAEPPDLYARLRRRLRRGFPLHRYWGPLASAGSSAWIADALAEVVRRPDAPELVVGYLPHLDYDLQRHGPRSRAARAALEVVLGHLVRLREAAREAGYEFLCFGDFAMAEVTRPPVHPNRVLREAVLLRTYGVRGRSYPDLHGSPAFVLVDHEIAGVYARTPAAAGQARAALERAPGVGAVLDREAQRKEGIDDPDGADLVLVAEEGAWFAYPWWDDAREAPDYATHVDIHRKPGYDPCELHFGFPPPRVSLDPTRIRGTHGRAGPGRAIAWATTLGVPGEPRDVTALAKLAQDALEGAP
jgi:predicted AlkP superfamily pyrophosphatase or phosphodiesterase